LKKETYICGMKTVTIIHPEFGTLVNQVIEDEQDQHKIFLNAIHSSLVLKKELSMFNGVDNMAYIPYNILKDCIILGNTSKVSLGQYAVNKIKESMV
jgi:hypothetical protein